MPLLLTDIATGELLFERGLLSLDQLDEANRQANAWNVRLIDVLLASNWIRPEALYRGIADYYDLRYVNVGIDLPDPNLIDVADAENYARELVIPWREEEGRLVFAAANPGAALIADARKQWGDKFEVVVTSKFDLLLSMQKLFGAVQTRQAAYELSETDPEMSAYKVVTPQQGLVMYALLSALALTFILAPLPSFIAVNLLMTLFYSGGLAFKALLVWVGAATRTTDRALEIDARLLREDELPIFSILVPMFEEAEVLPILADALRKLDYPRAKLDIKLVLEQHDTQTIKAARKLGLEGVFEIILVPSREPQTKPKACNYALKFCRGEYVVIYDAEDRPDPDQLRKVVAAFRRSSENTACIQCRLNYFNVRENWITRMFTLDYSLWFDLMLPGLDRLGVPIPLGGTSNHFRTDILRKLGAWDPFNVTEDADLGIRMTQKGYRVGVIDSTTYEEATCTIGSWIKQRSRWVKGYMQTFLVHTRHPIRLVRNSGLLGTAGFLFFVGGTALSGILNPVFWMIFLIWAVTATSGLDALFPPWILGIALFNLIAGNGLFMYLAVIATFRRGWIDLAPFGLTVGIYWALMSVAAYKALWQLASKPFYWEKTMHGVSKVTRAELEEANASAGEVHP